MIKLSWTNSEEHLRNKLVGYPPTEIAPNLLIFWVNECKVQFFRETKIIWIIGKEHIKEKAVLAMLAEDD
jgi:hypothetical protein